MEPSKLDKAIYILELKIAKEIKNNKATKYDDFKNKIKKLQDEKEKIYKGDIETIDKVLSEYLNEVI